MKAQAAEKKYDPNTSYERENLERIAKEWAKFCKDKGVQNPGRHDFRIWMTQNYPRITVLDALKQMAMDAVWGKADPYRSPSNGEPEHQADHYQKRLSGDKDRKEKTEAARTRKVGDVVYMTPDALDNYGEQYAGKPLTITHVSTKYMPAKEFYAKGKPDGYHPGYDESMNGMALYDFDGLNSSLYEYEIRSQKSTAAKIDRVWVVMYPNPQSEISDILFSANVEELQRQFKGGLDAKEVFGMYDNEKEARGHARSLLDALPGKIEGMMRAKAGEDFGSVGFSIDVGEPHMLQDNATEDGLGEINWEKATQDALTIESRMMNFIREKYGKARDEGHGGRGDELVGTLWPKDQAALDEILAVIEHGEPLGGGRGNLGEPMSIYDGLTYDTIWSVSLDFFNYQPEEGITTEGRRKVKAEGDDKALIKQMLAALKKAELSTTQIAMVSEIGKKSKDEKIRWFESQLKQLGNELRAAIEKAGGNVTAMRTRADADINSDLLHACEYAEVNISEDPDYEKMGANIKGAVKTLRRAINKAKPGTFDSVAMKTTADADDEGGDLRTELTDEDGMAIIDKIQNTPDMQDSEFHEFVEGLGIEPSAAETFAYGLLYDLLNEDAQPEPKPQADMVAAGKKKK